MSASTLEKTKVRAALAAGFWTVIWFLTRRYTAGWELAQIITSAGFCLVLALGIPWVLVGERESRSTYRQGERMWHGDVEISLPGLSDRISFTLGWAVSFTVLSIALNFALETFTRLSLRPKFLVLGPNDSPLLAAGAVWTFWCFFTGNFRWIFADVLRRRRWLARIERAKPPKPGLDPARLRELAELYRTWSTEQLVSAVRIGRGLYEPEAVALMEEELRRREAPE
jgi:hypothetical protein